ncbi:MAG TPA: GxxExxY protein [Thermoanaerobaculia bacterium]|nr:GxxExxY protein [Thermoanaerobaculia bacterium]
MNDRPPRHRDRGEQPGHAADHRGCDRSPSRWVLVCSSRRTRSALSRELTLRDIPFDRQFALPVDYKGVKVDCAYRLDLFVASRVVVDVKAASEINPLHEAQLITYMKLAKCRLGLLINFNVPVLKNGIRRRIL